MVSRGAPLVVAVCTCVGFLLRLRGIDQSLWTDEFLTLGHVDGSFGHMIDGLIENHRERSENNPPLYFALAWASAQLGDPKILLRLPSLVLGTATIPLAYILGARTVGRTAAAAGAAFLAFSPFAIYYSNEGRPYATLTFLTALSTLALLVALKDGRWRWWVAYAAAVCAVLYTHNTGAFVLAAQGTWALWVHRTQWKRIVGANLAAIVGFLPWVPYIEGRYLWIFDLQAAQLHLGTPQAAVVWLMGVPFVPVSVVPGVVPFALLALGVALGLLGALRRPPPPNTVLLLVLLAVATPLGLLAYRAVSGHNLFAFARNLSASLVPALLVVGWLLTRPQRAAFRAAALGMAGLAFALVAVETLDDRFARPPFNTVADFVDSNGPTDPVLYGGTTIGKAVLRDYMNEYLDGHRPLFSADDAGFERALHAVRPGGHLYATWLQSTEAPSISPRVARELRLVEEHQFPPGKPWDGSPGLVVAVYSPRS